jgi:hypothetical protein
MPKRKKSDHTVEEISDMSESSVAVSASSFSSAKEEIANAWPSCWTFKQKNEFCEKNVWLCTKNRKIGCGACHKVQTLGIEAKMGMKIKE